MSFSFASQNYYSYLNKSSLSDDDCDLCVLQENESEQAWDESKRRIAYKYARKWYDKHRYFRMLKSVDEAYSGLFQGIGWKQSFQYYGVDSIEELSNLNVENLHDSAKNACRDNGIPEFLIDSFIDKFSRLKFCLIHHSSNLGYNPLKSLCKLTEMSQAELINADTDILNTQKYDISWLSNNGFVFFKMQLDPDEYNSINYHRSRFGSEMYIFPLESTSLTKIGHIYTLDPISTENDEVTTDMFSNTIFGDKLLAGCTLREVDIPPTDRNAEYYYPETGTTCLQPGLQVVFNKSDVLKGLALYILVEASKMHPDIFQYLLQATSLEAEDVVKLIDVMLTRALKIQALLPGEFKTGFKRQVSMF